MTAPARIYNQQLQLVAVLENEFVVGFQAARLAVKQQYPNPAEGEADAE